MVEKAQNRHIPIILILCFSLFFLSLWALKKRQLEPFLFGGYTVILVILSGIIFACVWHIIKSFWIMQNNANRYIVMGSLILILTSVYYVRIIPLNDHGEGNLYPLLADALAHKQFYLEPLPSAELLALPDPYAPEINGKYKIHDASLFNGKYYIYFGPVPAIILMAVNGLFNAGAGNDFLINLFLSFSALMLFLIIYRVWQKSYQGVSWKVALLCFITIIWSFPMMWLVGRPAIYEAAISGGQAFLLSGLYLLFLAFDEGKNRNLLLIGAGSALGLAVGTRWSLAVPITFLSIPVMILFIKPILQKKAGIKPLLSFITPMILLASLYGYYNFARFGSPFELGTNYQLTVYNLKQVKLFSLERIKNNLIRYCVMPPADLSFQYPFINFAGGENQALYDVYGVTPIPKVGYVGYESLAAIYWMAPLSLIGLYTVFRLVQKSPGVIIRQWRLYSSSINDWFEHKEQLFPTLLTLAALGGFIPLLFVAGTSMRYHMDYFPAIGLLASIGVLRIFSLEKIFSYRVFVKTVLIFLAVYTILFGAIASITSYYLTFSSTAPEVVIGLNTFAHTFMVLIKLVFASK